MNNIVTCREMSVGGKPDKTDLASSGHFVINNKDNPKIKSSFKMDFATS